MNFLKKIFGTGARPEFPGWTICSPDDIQSDSQVVDKLYRREQQGYWVRGFLSPEEVAGIRDNLASWPEDSKVEISFGRTYGKTLMGSDPDLEHYLSMTERFRENLETLSGFSFEARMIDFFERITAGRKVLIPQSADGRSYSPANIRELEPGQGGLHAHIGNEFIHQYPELFPLAKMAVLDDQLSYFVVLRKPTAGGGLKLFDLDWENTPDRLVNGDLLYYSEERNRELDPWYRFTVQPEEGDLILFAGGRVWHQVEDLQGHDPRITIGGFAAPSHDDQSFYFWS